MLKANSLSVKLKHKQILNGLTFEVASGTCVGILGPNGSGKTTLVRAISGAIPHEGTLSLKENPLSSWNRKQLASTIATVQQNQSIYFDFTVRDFIILGRLPHKSWLEHVSTKDHELVDDILTSLKLHPLKERLITSLSGGERQRVLLAQALTQTPELLLLDEPTANLDIYFQLDFLNQIRNLVDDGMTVIAVFHDIEMALKYSDIILVLKNGLQVTFGPSEEVITQDLLEDVFRVDSNIIKSPNNHIHIQYLNTH